MSEPWSIFHGMERELSDREFGFVLPDGRRLVGAPGSRHGVLAGQHFTYAGDDAQAEEGEGAFFMALAAGWVSYSTGPTHLALHCSENARAAAAAFVLANLDKSDFAVDVWSGHQVGRVTGHFGPDGRGMARWLATGVRPLAPGYRLMRRATRESPWEPLP